ncbi:putative membrane protein YfcA [Nakamurella flavida]|nr:putative membrane protein YfcA [Nakamurella flavida]
MVPVLLILALVLVVAQPWIQGRVRARAERSGRDVRLLSRGRLAALAVATYAVGVYGGYFAAAQGILLVGLMGVLLPETMQRMNAAKNLLSLMVNLVAAITYTIVAFDRISWAAAGLIAAGSLVGGFVGAKVGRRLPPAVLRGLIVVLGLVALWRLF